MQRARILAAAESCFVEHGFQTATMADIADRAGISAGLAYRYFENKQAIILAIIERHLALNRKSLGQLEHSIDLVLSLAQGFELWSRGDPAIWHVALICEATAEASRDPGVAKSLLESDLKGREALLAWLQRRDAERGHPDSPHAKTRAARALMVQCLAEGLALRALREPDLDRSLLNDMLRLASAAILPDPEA